MATTAEAGWYDDGTGKQRWWDGARWTEHYVDLAERDVELRVDPAPPVSVPISPGWYDDRRGRQRWWDGNGWTSASKFSGEEQTFAGLVVDGRWIHFGAMSEPIANAQASFESGAALIKRGRLSRPAVARTLFGPSPITPRLLKRALDPQSSYLLVEVSGQVWLAMVAAGRDAEAQQFATWINNVAEHYRYR